MNIQELLHILACPQCHGDLTLQGEPSSPTALLCAHCSLLYPIREDIPILLVEEALPLEPTNSDAQKA